MAETGSSRIVVIVLLALVAAGAAGYLVGRGREAGRAGEPVASVAAPAPAASPAAPTAPAAAPAEQLAEAAAPAPRAGTLAERNRRPAPAPAVSEPRDEDRTSPPAPAPEPGPEPEPAETTVVVPAGTHIRLRLLEGVSSQSATIGQAIVAEVVAPLAAGGITAIPSGARVHGRVTDAQALKRVGGRARLALAFESVETGGGTVAIEAAFARDGQSETGKDAATIAAGAAVGAVLGNQSKHNDRGKVLGGLLGAGVGTAIAAATEGEKVELGPGAELELTLRAEVPVRVRL